MFDHVTIRASDRDGAERFFDTLLPGLGIEKTYADEHFAEWGDFSLTGASAETPATRRLHIGFVAPSRAHVDEFWRIGTEAGYRDDGPPGPRAQYRDDYYGAFLLDPDGNSIEAVHHGDMRRGGGIDHIWIRVADVDAARAFYEILAAHGGLRAIQDSPDHAYVAGDSGSFSLVPGDVTEHLHMAFPVAENTAVEAFHRAATEAGYRDNGPPAERPVYHDGYYAAFVLDPDGNNIELVNHNRS